MTYLKRDVTIHVPAAIRNDVKVRLHLHKLMDPRLYDRTVHINWGGVRRRTLNVIAAIQLAKQFRPARLLSVNLKGNVARSRAVQNALEASNIGATSVEYANSIGVDPSDPTSRSLGTWTSLGGFGWTIREGTQCNLSLSSEAIRLLPVEGERRLEFAWGDLATIEIDGPGEVITDAGLIGGGFGVGGAVLGIAAAGILNALTTEHSINTLLRLANDEGEVTLHGSRMTPTECGFELAEGLSRMASAARQDKPTDVLDRLERLGRLRDSGAISEAEFHQIRQKIIEEMT